MGTLIFFGLFVFLPVGALIAVGLERAWHSRHVERRDREIWNEVMRRFRIRMRLMTSEELAASLARTDAERRLDARREYDAVLKGY